MAAMRYARILCALLLCGCVAGESSSDKNTGGTLAISTGGDPDVLIPSLAQTVQAAQMMDMIFDRLADIGDSLNTLGDKGFTPRLADRWTWSADSLSIAFHINPNAKWHDGVPVRSNDVRFTVMSAKDSTVGSPVASVITSIDSVSTPDSATAVYWFHARSPQQFYDAVSSLRIMPEHVWKSIPPASWRASGAAKNPIGSGQYRFVRWIPRAAVELVSDTANYRGAPKLSRVIWSIAPDFNTAVTRFLTGETDFFEALRPENLPEVAKHPDLRTKQYHALAYQFAQFNLRDPKNHARPHPIFSNRELRRALTMATDRAALVRSVYDTLALPALGPTVRSYPTTDPNLPQIPFDLPRARQILDSLGWRVTGSDSIRSRNGRPLQFTISVPNSSKARVQLAVLLQEQLRQAGVKVDIEQLDFPVVVEKTRKRAFDVTIGQFNTEPSPGAVRGSWGTAGSRATSGNNFGSYESPVFDAYVDSALASFDMAKRKAYFSQAYETIIQDAPAIWLAEPFANVGYHSRLQLATLRPDAWWIHIPEWSIPAEKRIPRDNTPASTTVPPALPAGQKTP
ncbi:MAG TPA: peptide ABC transporter substrate-binding protein [Gemmatimonadaceae bacterium]|nr:peptide ABC transporter substrate-binding protein [Gemmatimonadaceae bacterium]